MAQMTNTTREQAEERFKVSENTLLPNQAKEHRQHDGSHGEREQANAERRHEAFETALNNVPSGLRPQSTVRQDRCRPSDRSASSRLTVKEPEGACRFGTCGRHDLKESESTPMSTKCGSVLPLNKMRRRLNRDVSSSLSTSRGVRSPVGEEAALSSSMVNPDGDLF